MATTPFVGNPDAIVCAVSGTYFDKPVSNILAFDFHSVPTETDVENLAGAVQEAWLANVVPILNGDYTHTAVTARSMASNEGAQFVSAMTTPAVGGHNAELQAFSSSQALCVTFHTATAGRSGRGRIYIPGGTRQASLSNYANTTWADTVVPALLDVFSTVLTGTGATHVIYSRKHAKAWRETAALYPVNSVLLRNYRIDSQRRRMPKD